MSTENSQLMDRYVETLKVGGHIESAEVELAFRRVQRHRLIEQFYNRI